MTLVAAVQHGDRITFVGDTKVTFEEDEIQSARLFDEALPKLVLLQDHVVVAVSGDGPTRIIEDLVGHRDDDFFGLLEYLRSDTAGDFLVGTLRPPTLFRVAQGRIDSVPEGEVAWAGDGNAFDDLQRLFDGWTESDGEDIKLHTSMQQLVGPLGRHRGVGGYSITVGTTNDGFRFFGNEFTIFGVDNLLDWYRGVLIPGMAPTPGAIGIYVRDAQVGRLYCHDRPFQGTKIPAATIDEFIRAADDEYGQRLQPPPPHRWMAG